MKNILIVLSVLQIIGILSSAYLGGGLMTGIHDMQAGILLLLGLWAAWGLYTFFKKK